MTAVEQPSGTVTLVFTDIEGSTGLLEELGTEGYLEALAAHRNVVRTACARHQGYEVDYEGDAFFYAFASAEAAVSAVSEAMVGLEAGPIRIRVGIHTGEPGLDPPKYVGLDVHRAARIMAAAHGGQVVLSSETAERLHDGSFELRDLGDHRFKDLGAAERIYQLGTGTHPPLKSLYRLTLPVPPTPFVGREQELESVVRLLTDPHTRVLTLIGPGGTGKTRLALQAAAEVLDRFPDGVTWVGLAPLRDPASLLSTVARALEVRERPGVAPLDAVAQALLGKKAVILLDNAEHLLPRAADELTTLLRSCPTLKVLVTSRERLRIAAETSWPVPTLEERDGERLFVDRARAAGIDLTTDTNVPELCRRLEELPLALELAAARTVVFAPAQLLERLGQRLDLLKGDRDADPRQRTLRATIEWSYQLLGARDRAVYRALSVFAGGCTYEAAEDVARADPDALQSLVDKSLVGVRDSDSGRRFWMLETIREHAHERLDEAPDATDVRRRLSDRLLSLAHDGAIAAYGPDRDLWADRIEDEHANIVAALHWLFLADPDAAVRLAADAALASWDGRARAREGRSLIDRALTHAASIDERTRARALFALGRLSYLEDDRTRERAALTESIELAGRVGDAVLEGEARIELGWCALAQGGIDEAHVLSAEGSAAARRTGDAHLTQRAVQLQAALAAERGELELASRLHDEALRRARLIGNRRAVAGELGSLGWIELLREDYDAATAYTLQGLTETGPRDVENRAIFHGNLGLAALLQGDRNTAAEQLTLCLTLCHELGMSRIAAEALAGLAAIAAHHGAAERAHTLWAISGSLHEQSGSTPGVIEERIRVMFIESVQSADADRGHRRTMSLDDAVAYALANED